MKTKVAIVGTGSIGTTLVKGWLRSPGPKSELLLCDGPHGDGSELAGAEGATTGVSPGEAAERADVIILDMEPLATLELLRSMHGSLNDAQTVVSAAPGVTLASLRHVLGPGPALFRVVADPGAGPGEGLALLAPEPGPSESEKDSVSRVFDCSGFLEFIPENLLDVATGVLGSSAGSLAVALEGVEDGGAGAGLPRDTARAFVRQTALATALLLRSHPGSPADLKDQVASPGGTTIAGLAVLEDLAVRGALIQAAKEATGRSPRPQDAGGPPVIE